MVLIDPTPYNVSQDPSLIMENTDVSQAAGCMSCLKVVWHKGCSCLNCAWNVFEQLSENYCQHRLLSYNHEQETYDSLQLGINERIRERLLWST